MPLQIAVIGSGPSGIYATERLLSLAPEARVDLFDRALSPYGLVRYGVAPDHQKIKSVSRVLARTLASPRVRWFGNVGIGDPDLGDDLALSALRQRYHAVLLATGAPIGRRLSVPGAELPGSCTAGDVVAWYNGHPDGEPPPVVPARRVVVIGAGNVALDVARVLLKGPAGLIGTDAPDRVMAGLGAMAVTEVHVVARRGPEAVKFGLPELAALDRLDEVTIEVGPEAFADPADVVGAMGVLHRWSRQGADHDRPKRLVFHFGLEVAQVRGSDTVEAVEFGTRDGTGSGARSVILPAELAVAAIGYRSEPMPGLPFDQDAGLVPNRRGRVEPGVYVVGWAKRGPRGVIGTNRADAIETVTTLLAEVDPSRRPPWPAADIDAVLRDQGVRYARWEDWLRLDAAEIDLGRSSGRDRAKFGDRQQILDVLVPVPTR